MSSLRYALSERQCRILRLALAKLDTDDSHIHEYSVHEVRGLVHKLASTSPTRLRDDLTPVEDRLTELGRDLRAARAAHTKGGPDAR